LSYGKVDINLGLLLRLLQLEQLKMKDYGDKSVSIEFINSMSKREELQGRSKFLGAVGKKKLLGCPCSSVRFYQLVKPNR
jgi:hypothetical protein